MRPLLPSQREELANLAVHPFMQSWPIHMPNPTRTMCCPLSLRHVTAALLKGTDSADAKVASQDLAGQAGDGKLREYWDEYTNNDGTIYWWNELTGDTSYAAPTMQLDTCLAYLRDRIGVPRDMSAGAAMQLRAHLNWAIDLLNKKGFRQ
mmetsp:Transcript_9786/g.19750  ORF Transcript_9786/g.19750 Transcript_9786/m.19750 type:complete len:150 (-) Transcript_9786:122-571(-)